MKKSIVIYALVALSFTSPPAAAQNAVSGSASQANNTANQISASGAIASGGNVIFPAQPSTVTTRQSGSTTARIESAPALGGLAIGGGHPCAWTPGSGQISIIGGGLGAAGMTIDEACMLAVMGAATGDPKMYNAALYMIAARDRDACEAMYIAGLVSDCRRSGKSIVKREPKKSTPTFSTRNNVSVVALDVECRKTERGTFQPVVSRKVLDTYGKQAVMNACR